MSRILWRVGAVLVVLGAGVWLAAGQAGAAPQSPPAALPCPPLITCDPAAALAGDAANQAARAGLDALVGWVADGAKAVLDRIEGLIAASTEVDVNAGWVQDRVGVMRGVAVALVLPMLLAALVGAVIHQDPARLVRAVAVHLPLAVLGMAVAVQLTNIGLAVTDALCRYISVDAGKQTALSFQHLSQAMASLSTPMNPGTGGFLAFLAAILVVVGALLVWVELLLRSAAIDVAVMFLPVALSGLVWPATTRWAKRLVEILVALILSKFVIVAVINLAIAGLGSKDPNDALGAGLSGAAMLLLAGFAPFALLRLVPIVEAGVIGHLEGVSRRPVAAGVTSSQVVRRMVQGAGQSGSGGMDAAPDGAAQATPAIAASPMKGVAGFTDGLVPSEGTPFRGGKPAGRGDQVAGGGEADGVLTPAGADREGGSRDRH